MIQKRCIGLIGLGYWGKNLLRNLDEIGLLHTACDFNPDILTQRKKDFSSVVFTNDVNAILQDDSIKAVAIATPAVTHYEFALKVLKSGKDLFVEKPLAVTYEQGREIVGLAKELERIIMVGHILQYHPAIIKLKEMIREGRLGKVQYIYSNRLNIGKLRTEENILWSFAPHDISVILMLTGEDPVRIGGFGGKYLNDSIFDTTLMTLEFKNNIKAHVFVSWLHPFKEQKLVVVGSEGMVVFDDVAKEKLLFYPHKITWEEGKIPVAHKAEGQVIVIDEKEPLREELLHFAECISHRKRPRTDGEEGLKVMKVLEEAEKVLAK